MVPCSVASKHAGNRTARHAQRAADGGLCLWVVAPTVDRSAKENSILQPVSFVFLFLTLTHDPMRVSVGIALGLI